MKTPSRKPSPEAVAFATDCMDDADCIGLPVTSDFLRAAAGVVMSRVEARIAAEFWTAAAARSDS